MFTVTQSIWPQLVFIVLWVMGAIYVFNKDGLYYEEKGNFTSIAIAVALQQLLCIKGGFYVEIGVLQILGIVSASALVGVHLVNNGETIRWNKILLLLWSFCGIAILWFGGFFNNLIQRN